MIVFVQFTLTDLRAFTPHMNEVLVRPSWPYPIPFQDFVRGTGRIIERRRSGLNNWVGENHICEIGRQIKVSPSVNHGCGFTLRPIYKHLYSSENHVLTKYEFVFKIIPTKKNTTKGITANYNYITEILSAIFSAQVSIKLAGGALKIPMHQLAHTLSEFHYDATTYHQFKDTGHRQLISPCSPQIYIVAERNDKVLNLHHNFKQYQLNPSKGTLYGRWKEFRNKAVRVWVQDPEGLNKSTDRKLRITIMRLHGEYLCLRNIFLAIQQNIFDTKHNPEAGLRLATYFDRAINSFLSQEQLAQKSGVDLDFLDYFAKVFSKIHPGESQDLLYKIKSYLPNQKTVDELTGFINNGNINYINHMSNNTYNNSGNNITVGAQGDFANVQQSGFTITNQQLPGDTDYAALASALHELKNNAKTVADSGEDLQAVVSIANAAAAADKKDGNGVLKALQAGGKFVVDVATKFSASLIVELMKSHHLLI